MFKINFLISTLNKRLHTGDKAQSSSLRFGPGAINSFKKKKKKKKPRQVTKCYTGPWTDSLA